MRKRRSFKGWRLQDYVDFYESNYAGMSRSEVKKVDSGFYTKVRKEGFVDEVLPERKLKDFTGWKLQDYKDYMNDNYAEMSRSEVQEADKSFYGKIRREGFADEVLPESKRRSFKGWTVEDFQKFCNDNYSGMSKSEVEKADGGFYNIIRKEGFIDEVFPKSKFGYYRDINNVQKELELIIEKLDGKFPRVKDIKEISTGLLTGIYDYHGSLTQVKIQLGYADKEMAVLKEILEELGES